MRQRRATVIVTPFPGVTDTSTVVGNAAATALEAETGISAAW